MAVAVGRGVDRHASVGVKAVRFLKRGPSEVIRRLLDVREQLPTNAGDTVQPVAETRAVRYWEEFDEGIVRWSLYAVQALVAGQFAGLDITGFAVNIPPPPGSLWTIDEVHNHSSMRVAFGVGSGHSPTNPQIPRNLDRRWGPRLVSVPLNATSGAAAAPLYTQFGELQAIPATGQHDSELRVGYVSDQLADLENFFVVSGLALATLLVVRVVGRIIFIR